jgi:L-ornithine N5-oxygenase
MEPRVVTPGLESHAPEIIDVVGIGFGPSNLSLAVALREDAEEYDGDGLTSRFVEQQPRFGWHRGMLIDGATLQISFLKDLVTLRNPASRYSFISYLSAQNRLVDFINGKTFYPTRVEFHDYLSWVADAMDDVVDYATRATNVRPVFADDEVDFWEVTAVASDGSSRRPLVLRGRNLVLAPGLTPALPPGVKTTKRTWHSSEFLDRTATLELDHPHRFAVVGAGQSAAEVVGDLHRRFRRATVHAIFTRYGYSVAEETPFANGIFDPVAVDRYFTAPSPVKSQMLHYHRNTNYSVVDSDLLADLYQRVYAEKVTGPKRLHLHNISSVTSLVEANDDVGITVADLTTGETTFLTVDQLIYATGYRPVDLRSVLGDAADVCQFDGCGQIVVGRDYQLALREGRGSSGIFVQGGTEHSHGISSSLLSNAAVRAGEIVAAVQERVRQPTASRA